MTAKVPLPQSRHLATEIPGPKSLELIARRKEAVSAGLGMAIPAFIERGEGAILQDVDGNRIIDLGAGIGVVNVGNAAPRVVARVVEAVQAFTHTNFTTAPYLGYVEVCEALNRITPGTHKKKSILQNSGAEAVENAIKIARHATKRPAIVVFEHAYHGRTNLTMALTAKNVPYKEGFGPFANEIYRMPMPYSFHYEGNKVTMAQDFLDLVTSKIEKEVGAHNVAAIIIEPIQGEGGFIIPPKGFLPGLSKFATEHGIVFIADEVQTGFARTGNMFACEDENVVPDMIVTAKGIAGGMPISAVTGRAEIMDSSHAGGIGGTYGGNPVAAAAAVAVLKQIEAGGVLERALEIETILTTRLNELKDKHPVIAEVRGRGAMIAIEFVEPGTLNPNSAASDKVVKFCHMNGVIVLNAGTFGNVIRFLPPLAITDAQLHEALDVLAEGLATV